MSDSTNETAIPTPNLGGDASRFKDNIEGELYYNNLLTHQGVREKYFGKYFEDDDPLVAIPLTSAFIDRIISILRGDVTITVDDDTLQEQLEVLLKSLDYSSFIKGVQTRTLATGSSSVWLSKKDETNLKLTEWQSYYTAKAFLDSQDPYGYFKHYIVKDGVMEPDISNDERTLRGKNKKRVVEFVDDTQWVTWAGDEAVAIDHNFGFIPVTWFDSIDMDKSYYGVPYVNRFKDLLNNLNNIYSQANKNLILLQNVWTTNADFENPEKPISLNPRKIQFLGKEGKLEQAGRKLDLSEEWNTINEYKREILRAAQMPSDTFLDGLAKVESGVALKLQYTPLFSLMAATENAFKPKEKELITKLLKADMKLKGKADKEFNISIDYNMSILPVDRATEFAYDKLRVDSGVMSLEYFVNKWRDEEDNGITTPEED